MKENYKGYVITIEQDTDPMSPREWDNLGQMVCFHRRYNLPNEYQNGMYRSEDFTGWEELEKEMKLQTDARVMLPIYMYDHSGITIQTKPYGDAWDSGRVGIIFATADDIRKNFGVKRIGKEILKQTKKILEIEVATYASYLEGDIYYFRIDKETECECCGQTKTDFIDSCGGFYGQIECLDEAKAVIDGYANNPTIVNQKETQSNDN